MANLLNITEWNVGTSTIGNWSANGNAAENNRFYATDPWGKQSLIWEAKWDGTLTGTVPYDTAGEGESNGDGGFRSPLVLIDYTKRYRYSMWINRKVYGGGGNAYLGVYAYNAAQSNTPVLQISDNASNSNAYFYVTSNPPTVSQFPENEWILIVAFMHPYDYASTALHADSGRYKVDGTKLGSISSEFKWTNSCIYGTLRTYMYYCVQTLDASPFTSYGDLSALARQYVMYPRIDLVDGTEPTITQLLRGHKYMTALRTSSGIFNIKTQRL